MTVRTRSFRSMRNWYLWRRRSRGFLASQWAGGCVLVVFAAIALVLANLDATREAYHRALDTQFALSLGGWELAMSVEGWINDALMAVFFFVVGLEIKREIVAGHLSTAKQAALPVAAALGGMVVPAAVYFAINAGTVYETGWGIPMATDIAFAIGVLSLLGNRVPLSLKIFLTALAVVDDLGAILVIAVFYTSHIDAAMLLSASAILAALFWMNRRGVRSAALYVVPGIVAWYFFLHSGVHATISGVLVAMAMPTRPRFSKKYFSYKARYFLEEFRFHDRDGVEVIRNPDQMHALSKLKMIANSSVSPAQRLEHALNPFVAFIVMPVFALANAGVTAGSLADLHVLAESQGIGIVCGLVLGKPVGIFLFCWLTIRLGLAAAPAGGSRATLFGVACLGGIGFTMAIFIDNLAFGATPYADPAKIAVLMASVAAALLGTLVIRRASRGR